MFASSNSYNLGISIQLIICFPIRRNVLEQHKSDGLDDMGPIKPSLALCVFGVFVLVYFSLWKGVRSAGKVCILKYENCWISVL